MYHIKLYVCTISSVINGRHKIVELQINARMIRNMFYHDDCYDYTFAIISFSKICINMACYTNLYHESCIYVEIIANKPAIKYRTNHKDINNEKHFTLITDLKIQLCIKNNNQSVYSIYHDHLFSPIDIPYTPEYIKFNLS